MHQAAPFRPPAYANAAALIADAFETAFLPPQRVSVADYAAQHRWLANEGGGYVGRWRHDMAPYLVEPMEALSGTTYTTVAVSGPGQSGKTAIPENWLLASVGADPGDMLWYMPTQDLVNAFAKKRINTLIDTHDVLRRSLGLRAVDDSLGFKRFKTMSVEFLVTTRSALISKSAPRIVVDEWDASDPTLGDIKPLIDVRRQTFGRESTVLALSHPDLAGGLDERKWTKGIMSLYRDSTRCIWWWCCPECGAWSSPNPTASRVMSLDYPTEGSLDDIAAETRLICPVNGCVLEDHHRREMNLTGRWIGAGQTIAEDGTVEGVRRQTDIAGYWVTGLMSPFIFGGIGGLASARVKAERELEATGDGKSLKEVIVKQWGFPYDPPRKVGSLDANVIADRAEPDLALAIVPEGVRFLTAAIDIQANRFEWLVRGWGVDGESWVIDVGRKTADPATSPEDWDAVLEQLLNRVWPLSDSSGRGMRLRAIVYDSGGSPGVTTQAYDAWRRLRARQRAIRTGTVDGRDAWTVLPLKGMGSPNAAPLSVVYPDAARKDRRVSAGGTVPLGQFSANLFKDHLAGHLQRTEPGAWCVHFPAALRSEDGPHVWFEQLTAERRDKAGRWENRSGARNEATDLMVMSHVAAHLHGLSRLNWTRPPAWAAPWDANPNVVLADPPPAPPPTAKVSIFKRPNDPSQRSSSLWKPRRRPGL